MSNNEKTRKPTSIVGRLQRKSWGSRIIGNRLEIRGRGWIRYAPVSYRRPLLGSRRSISEFSVGSSVGQRHDT